MKYYFIYSAGGGGGEWDAVDRIWNSSMKEELKSHILIKFGDIFFNHRNSGTHLYKPQIWEKIDNTREWMYNNTKDEYVQKKSDIILDSGTAKAVSWITLHNEKLEPYEVIEKFDEIAKECNLLEKYVNIIKKSNIDLAVTLDLPTPFKVRASSDSMLNPVTTDDNKPFIEMMAKYANKLYDMLGKEYSNRILTIIEGTWTFEEYEYFISKIKYEPQNIAIGALSRLSEKKFEETLDEINKFNLHKYKRVHFLGCGGIEKVKILKKKRIRRYEILCGLLYSY